MVRLKIGLLAVFITCLWLAIGVLAGSVLAFFVYAITPRGPGHDWPAVYALGGTVISCGIFGFYLSWKTYTNKKET